MMADNSITKTPYDFGTAIFKPFKSGPGSLGFVFKVWHILCAGYHDAARHLWPLGYRALY